MQVNERATKTFQRAIVRHSGIVGDQGTGVRIDIRGYPGLASVHLAYARLRGDSALGRLWANRLRPWLFPQVHHERLLTYAEVVGDMWDWIVDHAEEVALDYIIKQAEEGYRDDQVGN